MHGDLNFPNVLRVADHVTGIVDFDQIGAGDPHEELARAIKWWSCRGPIGTLEHDAALAEAVLRGYGGDVDREVLAARLWMTSCLNGNSVLRVQRAAPRERGRLLDALRARADQLAGAI